MKVAKILAPAVGLLLLAAPALAQTTETQAQIASLLAQIQQLQTLLVQLQGGQMVNSANPSVCFTLSRNLYLDLSDKETNGEVSKLQRFLQSQGFFNYPEITGYYGPATIQAVQRWQAARGVVSSGSPDSTGYGYVGPKTRAAMSCGGAQTTSANSMYVPPSVYIPLSTVSNVKSNLVPDTLKIISPRDLTVSVGGTVIATYTIGPSIVANDPAIIERAVIKDNQGGTITDVPSSTYIPVSQSAGTYSFEWVPNEPGKYQVRLWISHNNRAYRAYSGVITVVGDTISVTDLLTPTVTVSVSPSSVTAGQSALLKWSSTNANRCYLQYDAVGENISVSGTRTVTPSQSTTYKVWCVNDPGTGKDGPASNKEITLSVKPADKPTIKVLSPNGGETYNVDQAMTIQWSADDVPSWGYYVVQFQRIDGDRRQISLVATNNPSTYSITYSKLSAVVTSGLPIVPGTYEIDVWIGGVKDGQGASDTSDGYITITPASSQTDPVVINSFSASPTSVTSGQPVTFSWNSNLTDTDISYSGGCGISAITTEPRQIHLTSGATSAGSGFLTYTPALTATYTLTCTSGGKDGSPMDTEQVTVSVN